MMLFLDLETYSTVPITCGAHAYAEGSEILLIAMAQDDGPVEVLDCTLGAEGPMARLAEAVQSADSIVIHNSAFDRTILSKHGLDVPVHKVHDTMVQALAHSLPGKLSKLCEVLGIPEDKAKSKRGQALIQLLTKPLAKNRKLSRATRETHPKEWAEFVEYARLDVISMRECRKAMPDWNLTERERDLWLLDQTINARGVAVDLHLAEAAQEAARKTFARLSEELSEATGGALTKSTQREKTRYLLSSLGVELPDLRASTVAEALKEEDLPELARLVLENRAAASATSPAKYKALCDSVSPDGRLRGTLQFCGASRTGRFCLAEGTLVRVKDDTGRILERPIEDVTTDDLVWDGESWVRHEGVVFSGDKPVITHDGVCATAEHKVYVSTSEHVTLGEAKQRGLPLWRGNATRFTG